MVLEHTLESLNIKGKSALSLSADVSELLELMQSRILADDNDSHYLYKEKCMEDLVNMMIH
jgi:hypothetical protein